jgi:hypothetical protein
MRGVLQNFVGILGDFYSFQVMAQQRWVFSHMAISGLVVAGRIIKRCAALR